MRLFLDLLPADALYDYELLSIGEVCNVEIVAVVLDSCTSFLVMFYDFQLVSSVKAPILV